MFDCLFWLILKEHEDIILPVFTKLGHLQNSKIDKCFFFSKKALTIHKKYILKPLLIGVFFRCLAKTLQMRPP